MSAGCWNGKTVLVTGGGRGLGAALCERFAAGGATVAVVDLDATNARAVADRITASGARAYAHAADIGDEGQARRLIGTVAQQSGTLDVLVNNAGVDVTLPIDELTVADFDRVVQTNLRGPFLLSKFAVERMRRAGGGHIVNIASTAAKRSWPNAAAYHASKWGLLGMSHALHAELRPHGIKVTAVIAGGMRTPFLLDRFPDIDPGVLQEPSDVAAAVVALLESAGASVVPEVTIIPMRESSWP
jgi:NAD(P)-dependent dehydrogenase (short-subunit alcohol dehydrogenase family)